MKILLIDNYDSFTYNIVEMLRQLNVLDLSIFKNDEISIKKAAEFDKIIISPGPATPKDAGNILELIKTLSPTKSILGICLGHQAIAEAFAGKLINLEKPFHGNKTEINVVEPHSIFRNLPKKFNVGLYHSWIVEQETLPECLVPTSFSTSNYIMSLKHKIFNVHGIQFHPESFMTEYGKEILDAWISIK